MIFRPTSSARRPRMAPWVLTLASTALVALPAAWPRSVRAETGQEMLARIVREYEAQRATIERPMLQAYAQRLGALYESKEKRRDPGAAAVAAEMASVQARLSRGADPGSASPTQEVPPPPAGPIELRSATARLTGGAVVVGDDNGPIHFAGKDSAAEWSLPKLAVGRYRLLWSLACEVGAGATVRLTVDGQPPRTLEVQATTASGDAVLMNLGEFTAVQAPSWVRVEVLGQPGRVPKVGPSFSLGRLVVIPPGVTMPGL
jgi:hypothetical protein